MDREQFPPSEVRYIEQISLFVDDADRFLIFDNFIFWSYKIHALITIPKTSDANSMLGDRINPKTMIASMRVNELQTVLSMFKMPKLGKKQELIQRCTELLRTPSVQIQVASQVKLMVGKNNRMAPYPVRGYVPNGTMMNDNTGGYAAYRGGQLLHPMHSGATHQGRVLRNLVVMDLPFYDVHQTLLEPMELPAILSGAKTPCKQSFSFSIPRESLGNWSQLLPLPRFEIQLRFFQVPVNYASQELADDFPLNCIARVEDQIVQLPSVIPTNKPNVEPKRPSRPVDITQNCLSARDATRPVRLMVEWTGDRRTWAVAVYLVYRVTSEILRDRATGVANNSVSGNKEVLNHWQEDHVTRDLIRARLSGATDDDIAMAQLKISLLCPLSRTRITLPARCKKCSHLQCFDLYNYLQMNEKRPTWRCPVCSDWAPFKYIIIDGYFQKVLASVDIEAVEIELLADGSYRTVKSECVNMDDDDMPSMSTANNAQSPLPNVTMAVSYPNKPRTNIEDVIVLSDSDDEEREAVDQAIRMSLSDSAPSSTTPNPRSRDSSIIILDDESPPRSTAALIQNTTGSQSSSSLPTILTLPSTSTHTLVTTATSTAAITSNVLGVTSRITAPQSHSVLNGRQSVYNNTASLPYYHQSQWSQTSASRPQYPTSQVQGLNTGATFPITYKTTQTRNLLGRYQPNNSSAHSFNYTNPSDPPQVQPFGTSVPNIEQVLASLVQQSTYSNGGVSTVDYDC